MALFHKGLFAVFLVIALPAAMSMHTTFLEKKADPQSHLTEVKQARHLSHTLKALDQACKGGDPVLLERAMKDAQDAGLPAKFLELAGGRCKLNAQLHALEASVSPQKGEENLHRQSTNLKEKTGLEGEQLLAGFSSAEKVKADQFNAALKFKREKAAAEEAKFKATYKRADAKSGNAFVAGGHRDYKEEPPAGFGQREWAEWKQNLYTGDMPEHIQPLDAPELTILRPEGSEGTDESIDYIPATEGWADQPRVLPWKGHAHGQEDNVRVNRGTYEADADIRR